MAWTKTTRKHYRRDGLRYASDTTAKEWIVLSPLLPKRSQTGRPPEWGLRIIMDSILYLLATGCQWRALPKDLTSRGPWGRNDPSSRCCPPAER